MISKLLISIFILSGSVYAQNPSADEDWSCQTSRGNPCTGNTIMISNAATGVPFINGALAGTCKSTNMQKSNTFTSTRSALHNDKVTVSSSCLATSTPCITGFKVCIKDQNVPAITLTCTYLKDFEDASNDGTSSDSETLKCGENGANVKTYVLDSGNGITNINYSCEEIYIEKPLASD